jgi:hypothetical protein
MRLISLAVGQTLTPHRNEIVVTDLDHHANITTCSSWSGWGHLALVADAWTTSACMSRTSFRCCRNDTRLAALGTVTLATRPGLAGRCAGSLPTAVQRGGGRDLPRQCALQPARPGSTCGLGTATIWSVSGYKAFAPHMGFLWGKNGKA